MNRRSYDDADISAYALRYIRNIKHFGKIGACSIKRCGRMPVCRKQLSIFLKSKAHYSY